jgi:hypothetical protein
MNFYRFRIEQLAQENTASSYKNMIIGYEAVKTKIQV